MFKRGSYNVKKTSEKNKTHEEKKKMELKKKQDIKSLNIQEAPEYYKKISP